jgi:hypothetical protein
VVEAGVEFPPLEQPVATMAAAASERKAAGKNLSCVLESIAILPLNWCRFACSMTSECRQVDEFAIAQSAW